MKIKGGKREGAGRRKGIPNKLTMDVKKAIFAAFEKAGGENYLYRLSQDDPRTFCTLLGKTVPAAIGGDEDAAPIKLEVSWRAQPASKE